MAQVVQIELQVDEKGGVTAFRNLDTSAMKVQTTIKGVATAGTQMGAAVEQGATVAIPGMDKLQAAIEANTAAILTMGSTSKKVHQQVGQHSLNAMDSVRLFRDEFGIHIPRSMEKTMAQSKAVMSVLNGMQSAMVAAGGVGIAVAIGSQLVDIIQKLRDTDDEVKKFDRDLSATAEKKFFDTAQFSMARQQFAELDKELTEYDQRHSTHESWMTRGLQVLTLQGADFQRGIDATTMSDDDIAKRNRDREIANSEPVKRENERHASVMANLEVEGKAVGTMRDSELKHAKELDLATRKADEDHLHRINDLNNANAVSNGNRKPGDKGYISPIAANAPDPDRDNSVTVARAEMVAKNVELARQESDEIRKLRNEANSADLKGFDLLEAQKAVALSDFTRKYGASVAAQSAISDRFHKEELRQQQELTAEIDRRERASQGAGLRGVAAVVQRGSDRQADINSDFAQGKYNAYGDQSDREAARDRDLTSAARQTDAEILEEKKRFSDSINELSDSSAEHQVQGFARIRAEGAKQIDALQRRFDEYAKSLKQDDPAQALLYNQGLSELNRGKSAISNSTNNQIGDLAAKNADDTAKMEREANEKSLPAARQREQEIRDQYAERLASYQRLLSQQEISDDDYMRRRAAAEREMNAELDAEARAQRDRLASTIEGFMKNPTEALKRMGEQQASKFAATMVQKWSGGTAADMGDGKHGGILSSITGISHRKSGSNNAHLPQAAQAVAQMSVTATTVILNAGSLAMRGGGVSEGTFGSSGNPTSTSFTALPTAGHETSGGAMSSTVVTGGATPRLRLRSGGFADSTVATGGSTFALPAGSSSSGGDGSTTTSQASTATSTSGTISTGGPAVAAARENLGMSATEPSMPGGNVVKGVNTGMADANGVVQLGQQLFGKDGASAASKQVANASNGASKALDAAAPAISGATGMYSAVTGNGGFGGALTGAAAGAQLGSYFGPLGTGIGAAAGAIVGAIGFGGESKANQYYDTQVKPRIANDVTAFGMGSMDYSSANDDLTKLDLQARNDIKKFGPGGKRAWDGKIHPDIMAAIANLTREQKAGRSKYTTAAAQFHSGGYVAGFGDFATSATEGMAHLKIGETVMHERATNTHGDALQAMLNGATRSQMASFYGAPGMAATYKAAMQNAAFGSGSGHTFNTGDTYHVSAIDTQSFSDALVANKHSVRKATALSYAENSGGGDLG